MVERPASVAKELIENAIDAGATQISVDYDDKGSSRIVVSDNGSGIHGDQVKLALTRHATSKIRGVEDLSVVSTLGFRGEALASIAAVSDLELVTRTRTSESAVTVSVRSGSIIDIRESGHSRGTRVDVKDLFAKVPARKKFLKTPATEFGALLDTVKRFALGYPGIGFELRHNGSAVLTTPGVDTDRARLSQVLGAEVSGDMMPVDCRHRGLSMRGFLSRAGRSFGSSRHMSTFINGRWVRDRAVFRSVMQGYRTYLLKGRYPAVSLYLEIEPHLVDVNVHPAKHEVRFSDPELVHNFIIESVSSCLQKGSTPVGRWGIDSAELRVREGLSRRGRPGAVPESRPVESTQAGTDSRDAARLPGYSPPAAAKEESSSVPEEQQGLDLGVGSAQGRLGRVEVIGQVFRGYIVCQADGELVLVDQHAAHERLIFEQLKKRASEGEMPGQQLLMPEAVDVGRGGVEALAKWREFLGSLGWDIESFGDGDVLVRAVPAVAAKADPRQLVEALFQELLDYGTATVTERLRDAVLATTACHAAVRVGQQLDVTAARSLLEQVASVEFAASCPHGRPVARVLTRSQIERMFGR